MMLLECQICRKREFAAYGRFPDQLHLEKPLRRFEGDRQDSLGCLFRIRFEAEAGVIDPKWQLAQEMTMMVGF
jgi:hypothetical protein